MAESSINAGIQTLFNDPEYRKMMAGQYFNARAPTIVKARLEAVGKISDLGDVKRSQFKSLNHFLAARQSILQTIFGSIGPGAQVGNSLRVDFGVNCTVGSGFRSGDNLTILDCNKVEIGKDCIFGDGVVILAATHPLAAAERTRISSTPVRIGDGVVLGSRSVVLPGVVIGDGTIVEPGSVVTRNLDGGKWSGVPARRVP